MKNTHLKMIKQLLLILLAVNFCRCQQQDYHSWLLGNPADYQVDDSSLHGALALAGGGADSDDGMRWFLQKALGGDVLVFRNADENAVPTMPGAAAYNPYFYEELGVRVDSVETIYLNSRNVANNWEVVNKTRQAEAIFFTGGDQSFYWRFIKDTRLEQALDYAMNVRKVAMGGTSAGLAIQGEFVFTAMYDSVTSAECLANPYLDTLTLGRGLLRHRLLRHTITDSHYSGRNRFGRLATWMARLWQDDETRQLPVKGLGVDDRTCVCVDGATGRAHVFGDLSAHFVLQTHSGPEKCSPNMPLTWHQDNTALSVYVLNSTMNGGYFDLSTWQEGVGGTWHYYSVLNGEFSTSRAEYPHWLMGNAADFKTTLQGNGSVTLVGGSVGNDVQDEALKWFLARAQGGDVLVFKNAADGQQPDAESDFYNHYFYGKLGAHVKTDSVETVFLNSRNVSNNPEVVAKVHQAEVIYFSGGDQSFYWRLVKNTRLELALEHAINVRKVAIGGNSAGMAIQGEYVFSALVDTVTSAEALRNPYDARVTLSHSLLRHHLLRSTITDSHYAQRDRQGRHVVFMARLVQDEDFVHRAANGLGVDENTTVCIDNASGRARVFGEHDAFFLRQHASVSAPERCAGGEPLTWSQEKRAIRVYKIKGTHSGERYFDLSTWSGGVGGEWQFFAVENGQLKITTANGSAFMKANQLLIVMFGALIAFLMRAI